MAEKTKELTVNEDELMKLMAESAKLQSSEMEEYGVKADYLILAKAGTKALKKSEKDLYIPELKIGDIFLQKEKKVLGDKMKVVPLAFITLFQEKESNKQGAQIFGYWNKEQAGLFPLVDGNYFNRQLPNGHILVPVNWVCVKVLDYPEIENGVIAFKSTGSRIWKKWKEDAKSRSSTCATLVYSVFEESYQNNDYDWTDFGFEYEENLIETDKVQALACLKKSNALREDYNNNVIVKNKDISMLSQKKVTAYIEDASDVADSYDSDVEF